MFQLVGLILGLYLNSFCIKCAFLFLILLNMSCPALFSYSRDAVAKILYSLLFHWLTERINAQVYPHQHTTSISILDIYGFEVNCVCLLS